MLAWNYSGKSQASQPTLKSISKDIHEIDRDITVYWMSMVSSKILNHFASWWSHVTTSSQWTRSDGSQSTKGWVGVLHLLSSPVLFAIRSIQIQMATPKMGIAWVNHVEDEGWSCLRVFQFSMNWKQFQFLVIWVEYYETVKKTIMNSPLKSWK